ncbi:CHAT domain-containing protein [Multifurca ochricompacta]|uniref:CHAT domain-containing protein n=1 Tax=Multifurca ochricompacta TaxID=376703 RepID=A0AAD4QLW8_9AGAM|nr:CHAT domain-containing protein [Multifurca ochricompacta]
MAQEFSIMELDQMITYHQRALSRIPRSHPAYTACIHLLARLRFERYKLSEEKEDLDKSIVHYTEAIFLPPSWGLYLNVVQVFSLLVLFLFRRSKEFKQLEDAKCAVEYLRYLRGLPLDTFEVPREVVTSSLVDALGIQVELEVDGTGDIEEMVTLCQELLTCHSSENDPTGAIFTLLTAILCKFCQGKQVESLDGVIQCLRDALNISPAGSHNVLLGLAASLLIRYITNYSNGDYDEAMTLLESVIASSPLRDDQIKASVFAATLARVRASFYPNPEYLEEATSRFRTLLGSSSLDNDLRYGVTHNMASLAKKRFKNFGLTEALQESHSYTSEMVSLASSSSAHITSQEEIDKVDAVRAGYPMKVVEEKIRNLRELISKTTPGNSDHSTNIQDLVDWYETKFCRTNDISDLEDVIKCRRVLVASADTSHPYGFQPAFSLGSDLYMAFKCSNKMEYLDESITVHRGVLQMQSARRYHFFVIQQLYKSLSQRLRLLGRRQDFDEIIELFPLAVNDKFANVSDRFTLSCRWASFARSAMHPSVSDAYQKAMSLIQTSFISAPTLEIQHARLVAMRGLCDEMPLDYASYQIEMGQFAQTIETLEQGRALLWSEMRGLRNSMDHLSGVNSPLAAKLAAINQDLESLTMSVTPSGTIVISDGGSQIEASGGRDILVSQIQELSGFGDFLKTPSFQTIRIAASHGPLIIINHSRWRSDILILVHNSPPSLILTTKDFYRLANEFKNRLVVARKEGLDSDKYSALYVPYSRAFTNSSADQSLTGYALWAYQNNHESGGVRPPFSAHFLFMRWAQSHQMTSKNIVPTSLLLVANPDASLPGAFGEMEIIQSLIRGTTTSRIAHFVCHGTLETGKPFDASFKLFDDERLTLLDIVRSRLPAAEFAFLAACHTAELTDESIADEGLHLTAAVQYCGFRSVVGTMWEMADIDGSEIAENFYKSMFSGNGEGVGYHLRSARALRDATRKMRRKKGMTLERWVNFVHYGEYLIHEILALSLLFISLCATAFEASSTPSALSTLPMFDIDQFSVIYICVLKPSSVANSLPDLQGHSPVSAERRRISSLRQRTCVFVVGQMPQGVPIFLSQPQERRPQIHQFRTQLGEDFLVPEQGINGFAHQEGTGPTARISGHKWTHRPPPLVLTLNNPVLDEWMVSAYGASYSSSSSSDSSPPETPVGFEFSGRGNEPLTLANLDLQVDSDSLRVTDLTAPARVPSRFSRSCCVAQYAKLTPSQRVKAKRHEKSPKAIHPLDRLAIEGSTPTVTSVALDIFGCYGDLGYLRMVPMMRSALFVTCSNIPLERSVGASPNSRVREEVACQERQRALESIPGRGVISIDSDFQAPGVAVNSVAQRRPQCPSIIHSAKALEYMSVPDNLSQVGSGTILAPATVQVIQVPLAEPSTPVRKTLVDRE